MSKPSLLIYIHGFNSSAKSHKAMVMQEYCRQYRPDIKVVVPDLPAYPQDAAIALTSLIERYLTQYQIGLVGSSLGGYFSLWLNHKFGLRAVVVNPAVKPYDLLTDYLGVQTNPYTQQQYLLEWHHMDELKALDIANIRNPDTIWLLQQQDDEVLDYRQAVEKLNGVKQTIEAGGDHSFVDFERYPESIIQFLQL